MQTIVAPPRRTFNSDGTLTCPQCKAGKPPEQFYDDKKRTLGKDSWCKQCQIQKSAAWNRENPEEARSYVREWQLKNPEKKAEGDKKNYQKNRSARLIQAAAYRQTLDPEQQRIYFREHARKNSVRNRPRSNARAARSTST